MSSLNNKKYAYIFDFDGVLADSMELHYLSLKQVCQAYGITITREQVQKNAGIPTRQQLEIYSRELPHSVDIDSIHKKYEHLFLKSSHKVVSIESNIRLLQLLQSAGIKTAIASSSPRIFLLPLVQQLGINCDVVLSIDDVTHGKPNPELFLTAAHKLNVAPADCIVVEDADAGVEAAHRAGMAVLRYIAQVAHDENIYKLHNFDIPETKSA